MSPALPAAEDHPRVCGENRVSFNFGNRYLGSPPRVRGKPGQLPANSGALGITPACAGKTEIVAEKVGVDRDHPRVCGENGRAAR